MENFNIDKLSDEKMKNIGFQGYVLSLVHLLIECTILIALCILIGFSIANGVSALQVIMMVLLICLFPIFNSLWRKIMIDLANNKKMNFAKNLGDIFKKIFLIIETKIEQFLKGKKGTFCIILGLSIFIAYILILAVFFAVLLITLFMLPLMVENTPYEWIISIPSYFMPCFVACLILVVLGIIFKKTKLDQKYCMVNYTMHYHPELKKVKGLMEKCKEDSMILYDEAKSINLKYTILFIISNFVIGTITGFISYFAMKVNNTALNILIDVLATISGLGIMVYIITKVVVTKNELYKNLILAKENTSNDNPNKEEN